VEDGRIGRNPRQALIPQLRQPAGIQQVTAKVIQPYGLSQRGKLLQAVDHLSWFLLLLALILPFTAEADRPGEPAATAARKVRRVYGKGRKRTTGRKRGVVPHWWSRLSYSGASALAGREQMLRNQLEMSRRLHGRQRLSV
jgi:hypothetical protein